MDADNFLRCKCDHVMSDEDFARHFPRCEQFRNGFKSFDNQFGELLKQNSDPKENLLIIRVLLKKYVELLEKKISFRYISILICSFPEGRGQEIWSQRNSSQNLSDKNKNYPQINPNFSPSNMNMQQQNVNNNFSNQQPMFNSPPQNNLYVNPQQIFNNPPQNNNINTQQMLNNPSQNNIYQNQQQMSNNPSQNNNLQNNISGSQNIHNNPYEQDFIPREPEIVECCQLCKELNFTYLECMHLICPRCFQELALKDFTNMRCLECNQGITEGEKRIILGNELYDELERKAMNNLIGIVIDCPQCKEKINFENGHIDYNIKNDKNEKLSPSAAEHYASNRCRCPSCKIDFCAHCKSNPYHTGKTCDEHIKFVSAKRCRYDDAVITFSNRGPADDVCGNQECVITFQTACTKTLKCGHKCFGCKGENECPPCLNSDCKFYVNIFEQNADSYCSICYTEGLGNAPVVLLKCNHFIHKKCLVTRLSKRWIGPKITFNHCLCPQCNNWGDCSTVDEVSFMIKENRILFEDICKKAMERLKFEGLDKDPKLTDPMSKWYKNELDYALNRLSYYMCFECKKPYFAGLRECGEGPNVNNNNPDRQYDPKDLICGAHVNNFGVAGATECKTHGKEFIEYKCKYCCNIASWFCWGTTHFCEDCHARQCKGDYVSKYTKDKLPKCDPKKCPVKIKHPDNGEEFGLGCSVCRNNNENLKNF